MALRILRFYALSLLLLVGCANEVTRYSSQLSAAPPANADDVLRLGADVEVNLETHYTRTLKRGSRWALVGTTPQGSVYRPVDRVLTVEGAHVHEAYIVVAGGRITGFYLPVEKAFSPITPRPLSLLKD